jgi:hypothetical protein
VTKKSGTMLLPSPPPPYTHTVHAHAHKRDIWSFIVRREGERKKQKRMYRGCKKKEGVKRVFKKIEGVRRVYRVFIYYMCTQSTHTAVALPLFRTQVCPV